MTGLDTSVFSDLFKEAYGKCFGHPLANPLTETESKHFSNTIFDQTGLVIGPKSIKNYSFCVLNSTREENPSVATLDTLARYVLNAPYTDEVQRKNKESHYPYWFQYKEQFYKSIPKNRKKISALAGWFLGAILLILVAAIIIFRNGKEQRKGFTEDFNVLTEDSLSAHGWFVHMKDEEFWSRRNENTGQLSLFTLKGDNWPDSSHRPGINNLLLRKITDDCFSTEIHLSAFVPLQNWQQAGILFLEDTGFTGKSLRLSFGYNDFSGGFPKSREIIVQAIVSNGKNSDKPEEIIHQLLFKIDSSNEALVRQNLQHAALRIEKRESGFRLLYANGSMANSAFKEILTRDIDLKPQFIGLFALRGFIDSATAIPARFDFFSYKAEACKK